MGYPDAAWERAIGPTSPPPAPTATLHCHGHPSKMKHHFMRNVRFDEDQGTRVQNIRASCPLCPRKKLRSAPVTCPTVCESGTQQRPRAERASVARRRPILGACGAIIGWCGDRKALIRRSSPRRGQDPISGVLGRRWRVLADLTQRSSA